MCGCQVPNLLYVSPRQDHRTYASSRTGCPAALSQALAASREVGHNPSCLEAVPHQRGVKVVLPRGTPEPYIPCIALALEIRWRETPRQCMRMLTRSRIWATRTEFPVYDSPTGKYCDGSDTKAGSIGVTWIAPCPSGWIQVSGLRLLTDSTALCLKHKYH